MITAATYARKSTSENGVSDDAKVSTWTECWV